MPHDAQRWKLAAPEGNIAIEIETTDVYGARGVESRGDRAVGSSSVCPAQRNEKILSRWRW